MLGTVEDGKRELEGRSERHEMLSILGQRMPPDNHQDPERLAVYTPLHHICRRWRLKSRLNSLIVLVCLIRVIGG